MTEKSKNSRLYKQVLFLSILAFAGSGYFLVRNLFTVLQYNKTEATVLEVNTLRTPGSGASRSYIPTITYTTQDDRKITRRTGYGSTTFDFDIGDRIPVYYKPDRPGVFRIATFTSMWATPLLGMALGFVVFLGARAVKKDKDK